MNAPIELATPRLWMRQWRDDDLAPFAAMCANADVMRYFPAPLSRDESAALIGNCQQHFAEHGFGLWALERRDDGRFIGFTGLRRTSFDAHFTPAVEIAWRLDCAHWGQGLASEAARTALGCAFEMLKLAEVVSFTARVNQPSVKVMQAIGMHRDPADDFEHPRVDPGDPLRPHVLYRIRHEQWQGLEPRQRTPYHAPSHRS